MQKKIIYLPIEVKVREYHAKLLLAIYAIRRNYQVIIGEKDKINSSARKLPPGIYIGKSAHAQDFKHFQRFQRIGHKVTAFDEEGLVYYNTDLYKRYSLDSEVLRSIDHFFSWGKNHSSLVQEKYPELTNYSAVGNMRFELLKPKYHGIYEKEISSLRKKYGDYILINSNFGASNHFGGKEHLYLLFKQAMPSFDDEHKPIFEYIYELQKELFQSFQSLIAYLAPKIAPVNIIVRPHPTETKDSWNTVRAHNVFIENEGSVIPWILAAKAIVHNTCTTSIESVYLGTPVINYRPDQADQFIDNIANNVGKICHNEEDVISALAQLEFWHTQSDADYSFLENYVCNMHPDENVAHSVLDILDNLDVPAFENIQSIPDIMRIPNKKHQSKMFSKIKRYIKIILGFQVSQDSTNRSENAILKFPNLETDEVGNDIRQLSQSVGINPDSIAVTKIDDMAFHITAK